MTKQKSFITLALGVNPLKEVEALGKKLGKGLFLNALIPMAMPIRPNVQTNIHTF
jgi:hypothetical protein